MKRKGLGKGQGSGYYNIIPHYDSYVHSLSAKGVKSYLPEIKLNAIKETRNFIIDRDYSVITQWDSTSYGFRHLAKLMKDGREVASAKMTYYNRTWERYEYESVIYELLHKYFPEDVAKEKMRLLELKAGLVRKVDAKGKKNPVNKKNLVNYIMDYETGQLGDVATLQLFSFLIKSGKAWSLQGHYGRTASALIQDGWISSKGIINQGKVEANELQAKGKKSYFDNYWQGTWKKGTRVSVTNGDWTIGEGKIIGFSDKEKLWAIVELEKEPRDYLGYQYIKDGKPQPKKVLAYKGYSYRFKAESLDAMYSLQPRYDGRKSFYNKAQVEVDDTNPRIKKLYSYNTLVAEIRFGKPKVFGTYSQTTLRHIKEFLRQEGFKADSKKQILKDYGDS